MSLKAEQLKTPRNKKDKDEERKIEKERKNERQSPQGLLLCKSFRNPKNSPKKREKKS